jgi:3-methyladenine DNA glycosylase AlkC
MKPRTGARRIKDIPSSVLRRLNRGELESASLVEGLAVDFAVLLRHTLPDMEKDAIQSMADASGLGITKRMALAASIATRHLGRRAFDDLRRHPSDTVRGIAAFALAQIEAPLAQKLRRMRPLADDRHFGVREWAWLGLRNQIAADIDTAIQQLAPWAGDRSENLRRFAVEATRPRGVWARHIPELKRSPEMARPILDKVLHDFSRYVQLSCGNWLNDAAKSRPKWVMRYLERQRRRRVSEAFETIARRALRSIR